VRESEWRNPAQVIDGDFIRTFIRRQCPTRPKEREFTPKPVSTEMGAKFGAITNYFPLCRRSRESASGIEDPVTDH